MQQDSQSESTMRISLLVSCHSAFRKSSEVTKLALELFVSVPMQCHKMAVKIWLFARNKLAKVAFVRLQF